MPSAQSASQPALSLEHERGFEDPHLDWNDYSRFRPAYPQSLFSSLVEHHQQNGVDSSALMKLELEVLPSALGFLPPILLISWLVTRMNITLEFVAQDFLVHQKVIKVMVFR